MTHLGTTLGVTALALVLTACSGGERRPVFEGDLAEARNCVTPEEATPVFDEAFDITSRNPITNGENGEAFLEMARSSECVFELPSGLLYRIRTASMDGASPTLGDRVTVHYRALHPNGVAFNDSYAMGDPMTFPSDRLIVAWQEALPLMRLGEHWELYVHPELGYGRSGTANGPILPNEALVFELELLGLPDAEPSEDAD